MSDGDLRFPPAKRREPAKFEPPPWERELYDKLARARGEQAQDAAEGGPEAQEVEEAVEHETAVEAEEVSPAAQEPVGEKQAGEAEAGQPTVEPQRVELMMMGLRAEEPRPQEMYWKVTATAGGVSALIGVVITAWGITAFTTLRGGGVGGLLLAGLMLVCGAGFAVGGAWLIVRTLRQQGVL